MIKRFLKWLFRYWLIWDIEPPDLEEEDMGPYTWKEFVAECLGVAIDFDNMYGAQCVDVVRYYWNKVLGLTRAQQPNTTPSGGAKDLINNVRSPLRVRATTEEPRPGDVVVWGAVQGNPWGHTALVIAVEPGNITVMDQDGLDPKAVCRKKIYARNNRIAGYITHTAA